MLFLSNRAMYIGRFFFRLARLLEFPPTPTLVVGNVYFIWGWNIDFYIQRATEDTSPTFHFLNIMVVVDDTPTLLEEGTEDE